MTSPDEVPATRLTDKGTAGKSLSGRDLFIRLLPLIKAFAFWFFLLIIVHLPWIKDAFREMMVGFTALTTVVMGKMLFLPVRRLDFAFITVDGFPMEIIVECTAYNFYLFAIALVLFANWSWKDKLINLLLFSGIIFLVNNLRFFALGYIGRRFPGIFDTTHDYVWNILFGFLVFGLWLWRDKASNPDHRKPGTAYEAKEDR